MAQIMALSYLAGIALFIYLMVKIFIFLIKKTTNPEYYSNYY